MATREFNPIEIQCHSCGAATVFDIVKQSYHCSYCGNDTLATSAKAAKQDWINKSQANSVQNISDKKSEIDHFICPSCGANIIAKKGSLSGTCEFCRSEVVSSQILAEDQFPVSIIPFYLTREEAKNRLKEWINKNKNTKEARVVQSNMHKLDAFYLPYRIYEGPLKLKVHRTGSSRLYHLKSYLTGKPVSSSKQIDNEVLDFAEPFDFSALKPFDFGYIAGHKIKLQDVENKAMDARINTEIENDSRNLISKTLQAKGCSTEIETNECVALPALLPMYYVDCSAKVKVAINGQTGRVSVSKAQKKEDKSWLLKPIFLTLLSLLAAWFLSRDIEVSIGLAVVLGLIYFTFFEKLRSKKLQRVISRSKQTRAQREDGDKIKYKKTGKESFGSEQIAKPIFFEKINGTETPVKIQFLGIRQIILLSLGLLLFNLLPYFIVLLISVISILTTSNSSLLFKDIYTGLGWLTLSVPCSIILCLKYLGESVYETPIFKILENGRYKKVRTDSAKASKASIKDKKGETKKRVKLSIFFTPPLLWILLAILFLLSGFTLAMIF